MTNEPDEVERRGKGDKALAYDNATRDRILAGVKDVGRVVSVATVRAAVADVIDAGEPCYIEREHGRTCRHGWSFDLDESEEQTAERERFINAVAARIAE